MEKINFWDINWGPDEAKGDNQLKNYFVKIPEYQDILNGKKRYIIGRKGTGKTAILEKIRLSADEDPLIFTKSLSLKNLPLQSVRSLRDKSYADKSQFVPVWKFLIVNAFASMIMEDEGATPFENKQLIKDFEKQNFGTKIGFAETIQTLVEHENKVEANVTLLEAAKITGSRKSKDSTQVTSHVHYTAITDSLLELIKNIKTESKYFLLMDELDEGYRAGDSGIRLLLLALLRAVEDVALELNSVSDYFRPILVLRSDIFDSLEDNDLNKLDDYLVRLNWLQNQEGTYTLRDVVNARICASVGQDKILDLWPSVVDDSDPELPDGVKNIWVYISNRTMERPRDIIKYLKYCNKINGNGKLSFEVVEKAEIGYSQWLYGELRDEIHSYFPIWKESLQAISRIGKGKFSRHQLVSELGRDAVIKKWLSDNNKVYNDIISVLFLVGVLGNLKDGRWIFSYKDIDLSEDVMATIIVHYGFHNKLRLRPPGKPSKKQVTKNNSTQKQASQNVSRGPKSAPRPSMGSSQKRGNTSYNKPQ